MTSASSRIVCVCVCLWMAFADPVVRRHSALEVDASGDVDSGRSVNWTLKGEGKCTGRNGTGGIELDSIRLDPLNAALRTVEECQLLCGSDCGAITWYPSNGWCTTFNHEGCPNLLNTGALDNPQPQTYLKRAQTSAQTSPTPAPTPTTTPPTTPPPTTTTTTSTTTTITTTQTGAQTAQAWTLKGPGVCRGSGGQNRQVLDSVHLSGASATLAQCKLLCGSDCGAITWYPDMSRCETYALTGCTNTSLQQTSPNSRPETWLKG